MSDKHNNVWHLSELQCSKYTFAINLFQTQLIMLIDTCRWANRLIWFYLVLRVAKLHHYCITGDTLWIKDFLDNRKQAVVINGENSNSILVSSGVSLGSVLGTVLVLAYINELPKQVLSSVRIFAGDTAMYLPQLTIRRPSPSKWPTQPRTLGKDVGYAII